MPGEESKIHLESLPDAVVVVDAHGLIRRVNAHTEALFGYRREELVGQHIELLVPERFRERHVAHRNDYEEAPHVRPMGAGMSLSARHKDGREVPVEIMLSPGAAGTVVAVVRDISQRRALERFRDEFIGYISHDLKNPLSIITLHARLLAHRLADRQLADESNSVEIIAQSAAFIDRMVRELLEMSYLESEHIELQRERIEIGGFLADVLDRTVSTSDRPRVQLDVREDATILGDATRIERVIVNFLQNALKYAPTGRVQVRLEARDEMAVVWVIDEGPGIPAEDAPFVFGKYRRTRTSAGREGLGLGLYISRMIVEAHGGRIGVESAPEKGSAFYFEVPMAAMPRAAEPLAAPAAQEQESQLAGAHVLIVDDEPNAVAALAALLGEEGLAVSTATSGDVALALSAEHRPDAVLLDVEMPQMSGLALLRELRRRQPHVPVVLMTGYMAHNAGIAEAREATGAAYVGKPVDVDELLRVLRRIVHRAQ